MTPGRMCALALADGGWARGRDGASPCDGATASVPCKDMIPPASHEDAASLLSVVPSLATCESARVRVSHASGVEVSGVVVVVVVVVGVGIGVVGGGLSLGLRSSQVVAAGVSFVA